MTPFWQYKSFIEISKKNVSEKAYKKFQRGQHVEMHLLALKAQGKVKMELSLDMVSKYTFLYLYMLDYLGIATKAKHSESPRGN